MQDRCLLWKTPLFQDTAVSNNIENNINTAREVLALIISCAMPGPNRRACLQSRYCTGSRSQGTFKNTLLDSIYQLATHQPAISDCDTLV